MNVPAGAEILGEQRRKAEAIEALVADLCEGPPDNVSAVLRTALERGWREEVQDALREYEAKKQGEISRICNRHYAGFIGSAEELLKMRTDLADLRGQVVGLNEEVQGTGRTALVTARTLLQQRHATANIATTSAVIAQCSGIVSMIMDAFVHIHEERYYSALNTMDSIQGSLRDLDGINFAAQLRNWMPSLTEMINQATKEEMGQWLVDIREASYQVTVFMQFLVTSKVLRMLDKCSSHCLR
jgi:exocyst complex component 6